MSSSSEFYQDFKKTLKIILKIVCMLIALTVIISSSYWGYSKYKESTREGEILSSALAFTENKPPDAIFTRSDFNEKKSIYIWNIGDTDSNIVVKLGDNYSVFTQYMSGPVISFTHKAGSACSWAGADIVDNKIVSFSCDGDLFRKEYATGKALN